MDTNVETEKKAKAKDAWLDGLGPLDCCFECKEEKCAITHKPYCGHPRKGGLHSGEMAKPAALRRLNMAKQKLGVGN